MIFTIPVTIFIFITLILYLSLSTPFNQEQKTAHLFPAHVAVFTETADHNYIATVDHLLVKLLNIAVPITACIIPT